MSARNSSNGSSNGNGSGNGNGNIDSIPWWQNNGNDDDLKRSDYHDEQDEDIISMVSSLYVEDEAPAKNKNKDDDDDDDANSECAVRLSEKKKKRHPPQPNLASTLVSLDGAKTAETERSSFQRSSEAEAKAKRTITTEPSSNIQSSRKSDHGATTLRDERPAGFEYGKTSRRREPSFSRDKGQSGSFRERAAESAPRTLSTARKSFSSTSSSLPAARKSFSSTSSSIPRASLDRGLSASTKGSSGSHKIRKKVHWTCSACTFFNKKECGVSSTKPTIVTCEMCSNPHVISAATGTGTGTGTATGTETATNTAAAQPVETDARPRTRRNTSSSDLDPSDETTKSRKDNRSRHSSGDGSEKTNSTGCSTDNPNSNNTSTSSRSYSISELIKSLGAVEEGGAGVSNLPQSLERRVQDFRFAQQKRREKHGDQKPWGIYGLYAHLSDIRADLEWAEDAAWRRRRNEPYLSWKDFDSHRDQGLYSQPYFTYGIMVLCTILMVVTLGFNGWKFEPLTINPLIGPSSETLLSCGARDTNLIVNEGQWFRLFSPMILHAGLVHYLVNMLALYFIGGAVEKAHGLAFTAVLFVVPAVGGNILSAICLPGFISVGASGGIFGLIGGCMADICLNWNLLFLKTTTDEDTRTRHLCVLLWLAMDIIVNCLLGFTPFVDNFTHLGGFLYGFCIGFASIERLASGFFGIRNGDSFWSKLKSALLRYFGLVLSVVTILATTVVLARSDGVTSPCHGCRYISCVPFPFSTEDKWWHCDDCDIVTADLFMATDGSGLYQQVNIHCPDGEVEEIPIGAEGIYDREELRRFLPSYCRDYCSEVFANSP